MRPSAGRFSARKPWRPTLDDVENLSYGRAATKRGTGSRRVPHRLNVDERRLFELSKSKGFLVMPGSGHRKERKGSPLINIFRQFCDARAQPCISVAVVHGVAHRGSSNTVVPCPKTSPFHTVTIDCATLRFLEASNIHTTLEALRREVDAAFAEVGAPATYHDEETGLTDGDTALYDYSSQQGSDMQAVIQVHEPVGLRNDPEEFASTVAKAATWRQQFWGLVVQVASREQAKSLAKRIAGSIASWAGRPNLR